MTSAITNNSSSWVQPGAASSVKGKKRLQLILGTAHDIFAIEGYSKFTLRRIASKSGMHLASLQHYFASKEDLLSALIENYNAYHEKKLQDITHKTTSSSEERFIAFIKHQLAEHKNNKTCGFFFQLWSLSSTQAFAKLLMEKMYENYRHQLSLLMQDIRPDLTVEEIECRAILIIAMLEGMMLLVGGKKKKTIPFENINKHTEDAVLQIIKK
jgi:AcrR family transcriptional regulator